MTPARKSIVGYEGFYEADEDGLVYSLDRVTTGKHGHQRILGKAIKAIDHCTGYSVVNLSIRGVVKTIRLHRIIAATFLLNPEDKPYVNHINGSKRDNRVANLEWCTALENSAHAVLHRLLPFGERNTATKLTDQMIEDAFIRCMGGEMITLVAKDLDVGSYTLNKAFARTGRRDEWMAGLPDRRRRSLTMARNASSGV